MNENIPKALPDENYFICIAGIRIKICQIFTEFEELGTEYAIPFDFDYILKETLAHLIRSQRCL